MIGRCIRRRFDEGEFVGEVVRISSFECEETGKLTRGYFMHFEDGDNHDLSVLEFEACDLLSEEDGEEHKEKIRELGDLQPEVRWVDDEGDSLCLRPFPGMERGRLQLVQFTDEDGEEKCTELIKDVKEMIYHSDTQVLCDRGGVGGSCRMPLKNMDPALREATLSKIGLLMHDYKRSLEERL